MNQPQMNVLRRDNAGNWHGKQAFARQARALLKNLAIAMGLKPGEYDLASMRGGIAVNGEMVLHTNTVYIMVGALPDQVLVRACRSRRDYKGYANHWIPVAALFDMDGMLRIIRKVQEDREDTWSKHSSA